MHPHHVCISCLGSKIERERLFLDILIIIGHQTSALPICHGWQLTCNEETPVPTEKVRNRLRRTRTTSVSENRSQGSCSTKKWQKWGSFVGRGVAGGTSKEKNGSWAVQAEGRTFSKKSFEKVPVPPAFILRT